MPTIQQRVERKRGCGYRKKGGIYLVSDGIGAECDKLPIALTFCPCCYAGIKQARGFTWITSQLFESAPCSAGEKHCERCPMNMKNQKMGLMWVGEKFYSTADHFTREADMMGVSKRIAHVPKDFVVGETWIALAHPKAVKSVGESGKLTFGPGVFRAFKPSRIEYVVKGTETGLELEALEKRGFTLINVIPDKDQPKLTLL